MSERVTFGPNPFARPQMFQMGEEPVVEPPHPGLTTDLAVDARVGAGWTPEEAARITASDERRNGPMSPERAAAMASPDSVRRLAERVREQRAAEARQEGFKTELFADTGAPGYGHDAGGNPIKLPPAAAAPSGFGDTRHTSWMDRVNSQRDAASARRDAEWDAAKPGRRAFEEQIESKRRAAFDALPPEDRAQLDRNKTVAQLFAKYSQKASTYARQGYTFAAFLENNGITFDRDNPADWHLLNHYAAKEGDVLQGDALRTSRQENVRQNAMDRSGNGHHGAQRILADPESTYEQQIAAYTTLGRVDRQNAPFYHAQARLLMEERAAAAESATAADLARFNKTPAPREPEPIPDRAAATDAAIGRMPEGGNFDTVVTDLAPDMPGETPAERTAAATNYVESRVWAAATTGPLSGWQRGKMRTWVESAKDEEEFVVFAGERGVQPPQARMIYRDITRGDPPSTHSPVGTPEPTHVARVGPGGVPE